MEGENIQLQEIDYPPCDNNKLTLLSSVPWNANQEWMEFVPTMHFHVIGSMGGSPGELSEELVT